MENQGFINFENIFFIFLENILIVDCQGEDGEQDVCPRCQGKVFEAEKIVAKSGSFHKEGLTKSKRKQKEKFCKCRV